MPPFLKEYVQWIPDLGATPVAVVDFELKEDAQKACREVNMENRSDKSLRCALLKPGARIRRTLYRRYKEDEILGESGMGENNKMKIEKRLSIGSGGSGGSRGGGSGGGYCRTSSESVRSTVTMYPSVYPVINTTVTDNLDVQKLKSVSKKFITLESTRKDELFGKTANFVTNFTRKIEQPCSKIIRHPRGPGNNQRGFSIEYQNRRKVVFGGV